MNWAVFLIVLGAGGALLCLYLLQSKQIKMPDPNTTMTYSFMAWINVLIVAIGAALL